VAEARTYTELLDRRENRPVAAMAEATRVLATEWRDRDVRRGALGSALVTLGSFSPGYLPDTSAFWAMPGTAILDTPVSSTLAAALALAGVWLLVDAWMRLRPGAGRPAHRVRAVLVCWAAPFVLAQPVFSGDPTVYAGQGWLVANGVDPYQVGPGAVPGAFADSVERVWLYTPSPYAPLSLQLFRIIDQATGMLPFGPAAGSAGNAWLAALSMRGLAFVGVAMIACVLPALLRWTGARDIAFDRGMWFALLNPLVIVHFIGGAHNDALMLGFVALGLYAATRDRFVLAAVMVGVATAIKQPAALAGLAVAAMAVPAADRRWSSWWVVARRTAVIGAIAFGTFAGIALLTGLGFGWLHTLSVPAMVPTMAPSSFLSSAVIAVVQTWGYYEWGGVIGGVIRTLSGLAGVAGIAWLIVNRGLRRPLHVLPWSFLLAAASSTALHTWYLLWGGSLLPLARPSRRAERVLIWFSVGLVCYDAVHMAMRNSAHWLGFLAIVPYLVLVVRHDRKLRAEEHPDAAPVEADLPVAARA